MDERMRRAMLERRDRNYMRGDRAMDYRYDRAMDYDDIDYRMEDYAQRGRRNYGSRRDCYGDGCKSHRMDHIFQFRSVEKISVLHKNQKIFCGLISLILGFSGFSPIMSIRYCSRVSSAAS